MSVAVEIGKRRRLSRRRRRFALIAVALAMLGLAVGLALYALSGSIAFFHTPSEVVDGVVDLQVVHGAAEGEVTTLGDLGGEERVPLRADLWLEADNVLAKHDERYMPREAVEALKRQGLWRGDGAPASK